MYLPLPSSIINTLLPSCSPPTATVLRVLWLADQHLWVNFQPIMQSEASAGYGTGYFQFKMASMWSPVTNFVRLMDMGKKLTIIPSPKLRTSIDTVVLQQIKLKSAHDKAGLKMQRMTFGFKLLLYHIIIFSAHRLATIISYRSHLHLIEPRGVWFGAIHSYTRIISEDPSID